MPTHLRAFLFDASDRNSQRIVSVLTSEWDQGNAVCVLNKNQPQKLLDKAILKIDPNEVIDLEVGASHKRPIAIVETHGLAIVALTSGTTSNPKPVELTYGAIQSSTESLYRAIGLDKTTKWLCCLPPYYIAGLAVIARSWINSQTPIFHSSFDVQRIQEDIKEEEFDAVSLMPSQLSQLLDENTDLSSLQAILVGGSNIDSKLQQRVNALNLKVYFTYGMTETFGGICLNSHVLDNTKIKIEDNQIFIKSGSLMHGYRHDHIASLKKISSDGWYATGDLGSYINNELVVSGRIDDLINSGGVKVEPLYVEDALSSLGYGNVIVVGTPHPKLGECTTAVFTPNSETPSIKILRESLRNLLPATHLPMRTAKSASFNGDTNIKINRNNVAESLTIIEEYK